MGVKMKNKHTRIASLCILAILVVLAIYFSSVIFGGYIESSYDAAVNPSATTSPEQDFSSSPAQESDVTNESQATYETVHTTALKLTPTPGVTTTIKPTLTIESTPMPTLKPTSTKKPVSTKTPVPSLTEPEKTTGKKEETDINVLGFTTYYSKYDRTSYNSMLANDKLIDEIAAHSPVTDGKGNITGLISEDQITLAYSKNIKPYVLIGNNFSGSVAKELLESPANRQNFINNLLDIMKKYNYKGVNIDIEGVYSENRNHYTAFIKEIYQELNPKGYIVSASVPAKTYDNPKNSWTGAYDYEALSKYLDQLILMAYDEHWSGGPPGAVASIGWVEKILSYTKTVVPGHKIYLGVAAYGYDWPDNGKSAKAYGINGCYNVASKYNAAVKWDAVSKTPYFNYTDEDGVKHSVWFENAQSLGYKLDLAKKYDIGGIAIWRLGLENVDYWEMISKKIK